MEPTAKGCREVDCPDCGTGSANQAAPVCTECEGHGWVMRRVAADEEDAVKCPRCEGGGLEPVAAQAVAGTPDAVDAAFDAYRQTQTWLDLMNTGPSEIFKAGWTAAKKAVIRQRIDRPTFSIPEDSDD